MWLNDCEEADTYVAFRTTISINESDERFTLRHCGASWYRIWVDDKWLSEGPARFDQSLPEYTETSLELLPGKHCIAVIVHHVGVDTRMLLAMQPFLWAQLYMQSGKQIPLNWSAKRLSGYTSKVRRISPQLGWVEWCDCRASPVGWKLPDFADDWQPITTATTQLKPIQKCNVPECGRFPLSFSPIASGQLKRTFFYEQDDPPTAFLLCDLKPKRGDIDGWWWRYDLNQVRLGSVSIQIKGKSGNIIELGYSEMLHNGRVAPFINASLGQSANMDHYVLADGQQTIEPLTPRGARFIEIHYIGQRPDCLELDITLNERSAYSPQPEGSFRCNDSTLNTIWQTGINTLRACAEDAIVDNPTRERGQWLGDVANVGLHIAASAYSDLSVFDHGLRQSAHCANEDGLVAALFPGQRAFLSSFALNWIDACVDYYDCTGNSALLRDLHETAKKNLFFFEHFFEQTLTPEVPDTIWPFIDWGYPAHLKDGRQFAFYFYFVSAAKAFSRWEKIIEKESSESTAFYQRQISRSKRFEKLLGELGGVAHLRFHEIILGLKTNAFGESEKETAINTAIAFIEQSYPMNDNAEDIGIFMSDPKRSPFPFVSNPNTITPYFLNFALPILFEMGAAEAAVKVIKKCWGWALDQNLTTWPEFFSLRGSHCHQWSGCPTWLLSRYALGIRPRYDLGKHYFELTSPTVSLKQIEGTWPLGDCKSLRVEWSQENDGALSGIVSSEIPVWIVKREGKDLNTYPVKADESLHLA